MGNMDLIPAKHYHCKMGKVVWCVPLIIHGCHIFVALFIPDTRFVTFSFWLKLKDEPLAKISACLYPKHDNMNSKNVCDENCIFRDTDDINKIDRHGRHPCYYVKRLSLSFIKTLTTNTTGFTVKGDACSLEYVECSVAPFTNMV